MTAKTLRWDNTHRAKSHAIFKMTHYRPEDTRVVPPPITEQRATNAGPS